MFGPGNFTLSGTYVWRDKSCSSIFARTYDSAPSWDQVDLRAVLSGDHDRCEIVAYVKTLFDTLGYDAATSAYSSGTTAAYTRNRSCHLTPTRLYGLEVDYKF